MSRKRALKAKANNNVYDLSTAMVNNYKAWEEGPTKRKTWSRHDLKTIHPLTQSQGDMFEGFMNGYNIFGYGSAGTGKTFVALYLALLELLSNKNIYDKIIIVRSIVPTRQIGFLPGSMEEKVMVYERPYKDILHELIGRASTYDDMKEAHYIEFMPTSFIRGTTWDNVIVIVDEAQDMTFHEINSVVTRLGQNSRLFILGDSKQNDLIYSKNDVSGFTDVIRVVERMNEFSMIKFLSHDIVRGEFVKSWIQSCEDLGL